MEVNQLFSDGMILQRDQRNKIYGTDIKGGTIELSFCGKIYQCVVQSDGNWFIEIEPMEAGGPFNMSVKGSNYKEISQIYIGDVFLLAGQSNMELPLSRIHENPNKVIEENEGAAIIHQFTMEKKYAFSPLALSSIKGSWEGLSQESFNRISSVGYYCAKAYAKANDGIPIGLVQTAVGGTPIEAWCDEDILSRYKPSELKRLTHVRIAGVIDDNVAIEDQRERKWNESVEEINSLPKAYQESFSEWHGWDTLNIPVNYKSIPKLSGISGIVWLKRSFTVNEAQQNHMDVRKTMLRFGTIVDKDQIWINGVMVGRTEYQYPPRHYEIPKGLLKVGQNTITIKHYIHGSSGEFTTGKPYHIRTDDRQCQITLRGPWHYDLGAVVEPLAQRTFYTYYPTAMYHSMIQPLRHLCLKGILWYQGESNTDLVEHDTTYSDLFKAMITMFRGNFGQSDLPFTFVTLAGYGNGEQKSVPGAWSMLRAKQLEALALEGVGMASALDLGEFNDIHPLRKKAVGQRLSSVMTALCNGESSEVVQRTMGPEFEWLECVHGGWNIRFKHIGLGLSAKSKVCFEIEYKTKSNGDGEGDETINWMMVEGQIMNASTVFVKKPDFVIELISISHNNVDFPMYSLYDSKGIPCRPFSCELSEVSKH